MLQLYRFHYLKKDILQLENMQKFGLCMATKLWAYPWDYVLYKSQVNSLEIHRTITHLCTLFKLFHQLGYAECTVSLRSNCSHRISHHLTLCQPFCQTNLHYLFPPLYFSPSGISLIYLFHLWSLIEIVWIEVCFVCIYVFMFFTYLLLLELL